MLGSVVAVALKAAPWSHRWMERVPRARPSGRSPRPSGPGSARRGHVGHRVHHQREDDQVPAAGAAVAGQHARLLRDADRRSSSRSWRGSGPAPGRRACGRRAFRRGPRPGATRAARLKVGSLRRRTSSLTSWRGAARGYGKAPEPVWISAAHAEPAPEAQRGGHARPAGAAAARLQPELLGDRLGEQVVGGLVGQAHERGERGGLDGGEALRCLAGVRPRRSRPRQPRYRRQRAARRPWAAKAGGSSE